MVALGNNSSVLLQTFMFMVNQTYIQQEESYNYYYMQIGKGKCYRYDNQGIHILETQEKFSETTEYLPNAIKVRLFRSAQTKQASKLASSSLY